MPTGVQPQEHGSAATSSLNMLSVQDSSSSMVPTSSASSSTGACCASCWRVSSSSIARSMASLPVSPSAAISGLRRGHVDRIRRLLRPCVVVVGLVVEHVTEHEQVVLACAQAGENVVPHVGEFLLARLRVVCAVDDAEHLISDALNLAEGIAGQ